MDLVFEVFFLEKKEKKNNREKACIAKKKKKEKTLSDTVNKNTNSLILNFIL